MSEMTAMDSFVGCVFRHFKGRRYRLEGIAKHSETLEPMAVYRQLYGDGGLWVRPARMFFETIERDGRMIRRFEQETADGVGDVADVDSDANSDGPCQGAAK